MTKQEFVPIHEVNEHSDIITIGELGLPVGMDTDRLLLNVSGLERIATLGQIGELTIRSYRGDKTEYSLGIGGISSDGSASASRAVTINKAELSKTEGSIDKEYPPGFRWVKSEVAINNAEIEEQIKNDGDKWDLGVYDPIARAKYMNKALKNGLKEATFDATYPDGIFPPLLSNLMWCGIFYPFWKYSYDLSNQATLLILSAFGASESFINTSFQKYMRGKDNLPNSQLSFVFGSNADRHLASKALLATTKLIKAAPAN